MQSGYPYAGPQEKAQKYQEPCVKGPGIQVPAGLESTAYFRA
ncbi:rCG37034 [Rattus norvegicus]|uniref:RCG37034 n=1 Tax=Rattus norvegicus TaxID=10116 RepID=A6HU45_RAT|nr:rCG37034 [Rattus norvegicus]